MDKKEKVNWNENINARTGIAIILLSALILGSILSIPHLNVLAQNQNNDSITDIETGAEADAEAPEEEIISSEDDTLDDATPDTESQTDASFNETEPETDSEVPEEEEEIPISADNDTFEEALPDTEKQINASFNATDTEPEEEETISPYNDTIEDALLDTEKQINASFNETEAEPEEEETTSIDTLDDASLRTDKNTYSQGEPVNISLLSVPSSATVNLTIINPSGIIYLALEEETGLYSFTETTAQGVYTISANLSLELENETLTTEFAVIVEEEEAEEAEEAKEVFDLNNATLSVDKATYAMGETVRIYLAAPPEVISNFSIISPTGIIYLILPSPSGDYEFKSDSAGTYVINVSLRAGEAEKVLTTEFEVLDFDLEIEFGEREQCEIVVGEPVNWSQRISITNHENVSISNFSLTIPLPEEYSNLAADCDDARCKLQDASQTRILHPINIAASETLNCNITYQTDPVQLEVIEECIDISELIPPEAFDIEIYEQISAEEPALSTEIPVKQVKVWHNSSMHYHDIPVAIEAEDCEQILELVEEGTGIETEIAVNQTEKTASWTISELSNKTYAVIAVEQDQGDAEIAKPVEWVLNVSGTIVTYKTPAPYKTETEPVIANGTWQKEIVIGSNVSVHYSNVTAFSDLAEIDKCLCS
jgi:hypothetical protein